MGGIEPMGPIVICSRSKAGGFLLSKSRGPAFRNLISIGDPGEKLPAGYRRVPNRLRLEFADTYEGDPQGPQREHVQRILSFAPTITSVGGSCLIHCHAGVSRSTAAGLIVYVSLGVSPPDAVRRVFDQVQDASPNFTLVQFADEMLGLEGRLESALLAVKPDGWL